MRADAPGRRIVLSERSNFPTDLYIAEGLARELGWTLELIDDPASIANRLRAGDVAILMLTHVNYRSGRMHDMRAHRRRARRRHALAVWDLAHSAGAVPVDLHAAGADFAIGCGYRYLNGGPGARPSSGPPATRRALLAAVVGLDGTRGAVRVHADYRPAPGIARYLCGTPPVLSLAALRVRRRHLARDRGRSAAWPRCAKVGGADRTLRRTGRGALRRNRPVGRLAARRATGAAARSASPTTPAAAVEWRLRDRAGADRAAWSAISGRRRAGAGHPALRLHAAVHALRRRGDAVEHLRQVMEAMNGARRASTAAPAVT